MTPAIKKEMQDMYILLAESWESTIVNNTKIRAILKKAQPELMATDIGKAFYFAMKDATQQSDAYIGMTEELMDEAATYMQEACTD